MSSAAKPIGFAFIGAGQVAGFHRAALARLAPRARLVGLYDADAALAARRAAEWGVPAHHTVEALLGAPGVDVVSVLTPVEAHVATATAALATGHHVLIEKPVAQDPDEIRHLALVAAERGVHVWPAHNYLYDPAIRRAGRLIASGALGRSACAFIHYAIAHPPALQARYPGIIAQVMTHHAYLSLYLLGRPLRVSSVATHFADGGGSGDAAKENQAGITLEYAGGAIASLFATVAVSDTSSQPGPLLVKVLGERGSFCFNWQDSVVEQPSGDLRQGYPAYEDSFYYELAYLVDDCLAQGAEPLSTIGDAADAAEIVAEARRAAADGRSRVPRWIGP